MSPRGVRYLSVCSGIEAATVAWRPLGWQPVAFSEIDSFPAALLAHHYPDVPNYGDLHAHTHWPLVPGDVDLLVGGTPCQSFSVAGRRAGLADPRGNLALVYLGLAARLRPEWVVWENVPGVLSSGGGRDFGAFLGALAQLGYGWSYRVLDAQYFGVAQRRRRVFVVGCRGGDWRRAAAVLFDRESMSGHPPPRREAGEATPRAVAPCLAASGRGAARVGDPRGHDPMILSHDPAVTLTAREYKGPLPEADLSTVVAHTLRADGFDASEDGTGRGTPLITCHPTQTPISSDALSPALGGATRDMGVLARAAVRRLTPRECERLQGFPDDYTLVPYRRGKPAADGPRYVGLGNSMAVPCARWIGERIAAVSA